MNAIIEKSIDYCGYKYIVVLQTIGHRCGYVFIPSSHKYYNKNYDSIPIDCHGGLTFAGHIFDKNDFWIGFDCAHFDDAYDYETAIEAYKDNREVLTQLLLMKNISNNFGSNEGHVWTTDEVSRECESIIDQLIEGGN